MQRITTFLTYNTQAEDAAKLYTSVFKNSKIISTSRYGDGAPAPKGTVMSVIFELDGQRFHALNGGPTFKFAEGISLFVDCETQAEIDRYWEKLSAFPDAEQCGWLKDRYGLSWQIVPTAMNEMMQKGTPEQTARVTQAFLKMKKFDIAELQKAFNGGSRVELAS